MSRDYGSSTLHRNFSPRMIMYGTDGMGRDTYINFNNGGFWKDNIKNVNLNEKFDIAKYNNVKHLRYANINRRKNVAPFKYYSDGSGRDSYVIHESGGLKRDHKPMQAYHLKDFLRIAEPSTFNFRTTPKNEAFSTKTVYVTKREFNQNIQAKKLEKDLNKRLFYSYNDKAKIPRKKEGKFQLMLRSNDNFFPNITKGFKQEKLNDLNKFSDKLLRVSRYESGFNTLDQK